MSGAGEALEGALGLIVGGIIFLYFASALGMNSIIDFNFWGVIYVSAGILLLVTIIATVIGRVLS